MEERRQDVEKESRDDEDDDDLCGLAVRRKMVVSYSSLRYTNEMKKRKKTARMTRQRSLRAEREEAEEFRRQEKSNKWSQTRSNVDDVEKSKVGNGEVLTTCHCRDVDDDFEDYYCRLHPRCLSAASLLSKSKGGEDDVDDAAVVVAGDAESRTWRRC